jgi:SAM-dependent methyltransferase
LFWHGAIKSNGRQLLDVACGTGLEDLHLKEHFEVTGVDLNRGVLKIARKRNPQVKYVRGDMKSFRLKRNFDVVTCFDAMMYLRNHAELAKALKNFHTHLKPGGVLVFYIDESFLKDCRTELTTVVVDKKITKKLGVILCLTYLQHNNCMTGQDALFIIENGQHRLIAEPPMTYGLFEVHRILSTLHDIGFKTEVYRTGPGESSFSTERRSHPHETPVFVCVK